MGLFTAAVGRPPAVHQVARHEAPISREVFGGIPGALQVAFYTVIPVLFVWGAVAVRRAGAQLGAGRARPPAHHAEERQAPPRATSAPACTCRRCCATPPPALMHSLIYFASSSCSRVTTVLEIDHQLPGGAEVPARPGVPGATRSSATLAGVVFLVGIVWAIVPPLRAAAVPHPHQDQARARADPRHVPRASASPASSPRRSASPSIGRPDFEKWSLRRLPAVAAVRRRHRARCDGWHQVMWVVARRRASSSSS